MCAAAPSMIPFAADVAEGAAARAVHAVYGLAPDTPEPEIVAHLFGLHAEMMKKGAVP